MIRAGVLALSIALFNTSAWGDEPLPDISNLTPPEHFLEPPPVMEVQPFERPAPRRRFRHALYAGLAFGLEVYREGEGAWAVGGGAHLGWEISWRWMAFELGAEAEAHGDQTGEPNHAFVEVHPAAFLKLPFARGAWQLWVGYGLSPAGLHDGALDDEENVHIAMVGLEDRTSRLYSRFFIRAYLPALDAGSALVVVGATVGRFHLF